MSCLKQSEPVISEKMIYIYSTLDSVRDIELVGDTLYVANGSEGLKILKLNLDDSESIEPIYEGPIFEGSQNLIKLNYARNSELIFVLNSEDLTYVAPHNFYESIFGFGLFVGIVQCDTDNHSNSTIIYDGIEPEILTLFRHLDTGNEVQPHTTSIERSKVLNSDDGFIESFCDINDLDLDSLNYDLSDIYFYNDTLYLANPNFSIPSIQIYYQNIDDNFELVREDTLSAYPKTVRGFDSAYVVGLDNDAGCYIALLDTEGGVYRNFTVAKGYTIRDIHYSQNLLLLSAGYDGVLIYEWDGVNDPNPYALISSGYAYSALVYKENKIIIGTKNGIEIYEID